jgi:hypothetical protein
MAESTIKQPHTNQDQSARAHDMENRGKGRQNGNQNSSGYYCDDSVDEISRSGASACREGESKPAVNSQLNNQYSNRPDRDSDAISGENTSQKCIDSRRDLSLLSLKAHVRAAFSFSILSGLVHEAFLSRFQQPEEEYCAKEDHGVSFRQPSVGVFNNCLRDDGCRDLH